MEARELRIGNYLYNENSEVKEVVKIGFTKVWIGKVNDYWDAVNFDETSSIPLTEEWLLKFGFVNREKDNFSFNKYMNLRIIGSENDYNGIWFGKVHYVHQLQNLYFALTGEELKWE